MQFDIGATVFSRYKIISEIARGGFGVVYSALDEWGDRSAVAIKILNLSAQIDESAKRRFAIECETLLKLSHNNIVRVIESHTLAGNHVLIMEHCPSCIQTEIKQMGSLSVERTIQIGTSMCSALHVLHENGIFHRDIKPSNILISQDGSLRLSDLGIVRLSNPMESTGTRVAGDTPQTMSPLTSEGIQPGTLIYMAPEQLVGQKANEMSDIYSLGATLYEGLAGQHYLGSIDFNDYQQIVASIMKRKPLSLRKLNSSVPRHLDRVILRALEKDPAKRFEGASHLGDALFHPEKREGLVGSMLAILGYKFQKGKDENRIREKRENGVGSGENRKQREQDNGPSAGKPDGIRTFRCTSCCKSLIWVPAMAGKTVHCYQCGSEVTMPM